MFSISMEVSEDASRDGNLDRAAVETQPDGSSSKIEFSLGNPRVEHVTGVIHLYRQVEAYDGTEGASEEVVVAGRCCRLCVLAVPADVGVKDFCTFCGAYLQYIKEMIFLRKGTGRNTAYMVYLRFDTEDSAESFFSEYNRKPYSLLEKEVVWKLVYVRELEFHTEGAAHPRAGETELPTCPVCLERLDQHISGVVTTVCNHQFHNECLMKWGDVTCPVCRYCMQRTSGTTRCSICGADEDLWICLICGKVGCGRYKSGHAIDHWKQSQHCYALCVESQRVWDYVRDGYVHRLIRSKTGGKLIEVPTPGAEGEGSGGTGSSAGCTKGNEAKYDEEGDAMVASKLDAIAFEYNHLLTAQLESQRQYFEDLLCKMEAEAERRCQSASEAAVRSSSRSVEESKGQAKDAMKQCKMAQKKMAEMSSELSKLKEEKEFLRNLNETLLMNQKEWRDKSRNLEEQLQQVKQEKDAVIKDLEDQARDLIMFIESQKVISENGEDLQGGSLLALPEGQRPVISRGRRGARRQRS
ncbi:unnamed protein product [Ostreobium quekettii]|uniref:BRCA1-associated protein n=1 Tax=Ostreobium quekettii TaxID=121088 RepID=A0A8S1J371_9CHLO|nr:unnamed protein product [Ostreobium quekettii]|eukprot:evm.model.scf_73.10 EVM.evm.TU.scf_73.10   scf_73:89526-94471(-)